MGLALSQFDEGAGLGGQSNAHRYLRSLPANATVHKYRQLLRNKAASWRTGASFNANGIACDRRQMPTPGVPRISRPWETRMSGCSGSGHTATRGKSPACR